LDVASFAVDTVGRVQADAFPLGASGIIQHLVNIRRTKMLAGTTKLADTSRLAHIRVMDDQMGRLILFVLRPGMIEIGELVKGLLSVCLCGSDEM
jgi:hypothetical protein